LASAPALKGTSSLHCWGQCFCCGSRAEGPATALDIAVAI
jgi:hypothetical protein